MKTLSSSSTLFLCLAPLLLLINSCDSFVDVELPGSQLNSTTVFKDYSTANAALTDIYSKIRDRGLLTGNGSGLSSQLGNYTDELVPYGIPSNTSFSFYYNTLLPTTPDITDYWNATYNQIYAANAIIEGVSASSGLTLAQKNQLSGEALFIRALSHLYLANLYGDIPYVTQTDYKSNTKITRMPIEKVYEQIITDLQESEQNLGTSDVNIQRIRPNRYVVKALLARVYLYSGAYSQAANEASAVLNQTDVYHLEDLSNVFLINSLETIWQLQSQNEGQNTEEGLHFIFSSGPPPAVALSSNLVQYFTADDLRLSNWTKSVTDGTSVWYYAFKYKQQDYTPVSVEYSIIFRLAEQFLIRAEARANQGDLIGAKEDLNKIRNRAGLKNTTAASKEEILQAILLERKLELFTEHGHRFFDLKRFGKLDSELSPVKTGWKTASKLFPLPQSELSVNPNLQPQNPGY
ncbi:RagB/SusD family nutrient uptake outer membrane protein [Flavobacterium sp. 3-210]